MAWGNSWFAPLTMTHVLRHQLALFLLVLLIPGVFFLWRTEHLLPLYTDATTGESVKTTMIRVTDREGWLLSNVDVRIVTADRVTFLYREHRRGPDTTTCYILRRSDASLRPCAIGSK